jgi:hypothetical protein
VRPHESRKSYIGGRTTLGLDSARARFRLTPKSEPKDLPKKSSLEESAQLLVFAASRRFEFSPAFQRLCQNSVG